MTRTIFLLGLFATPCFADDHPQFELVSSLLLSALHAQSNVRLYVNGCGANNLMKITSVKIQT